jgi:hypothetical protein
VHEALDALAAEDATAAEVVKLRYFVGMTIPEIAEALEISPRSADRHWVFARAWLKGAIRVRDKRFVRPSENCNPVACFGGQLRHYLVTGHNMNEPDTFQNRSEKEIFFEALDKNTPEERAAFLDGACGKNPARRARWKPCWPIIFRRTFMKKPAWKGGVPPS